MQTPLQVVMKKLPRSDALDARIREAAEKLEQLHPRLTSCRVVVEEEDRHQRQGRKFRVKVEARASDHDEAFSTSHRHEDVYVAVRDAFDSVRRQLEDGR